MSLIVSSQLGHSYDVTAKIGEGGMGGGLPRH